MKLTLAVQTITTSLIVRTALVLLILVGSGGMGSSDQSSINAKPKEPTYSQTCDAESENMAQIHGCLDSRLRLAIGYQYTKKLHVLDARQTTEVVEALGRPQNAWRIAMYEYCDVVTELGRPELGLYAFDRNDFCLLDQHKERAKLLVDMRTAEASNFKLWMSSRGLLKNDLSKQVEIHPELPDFRFGYLEEVPIGPDTDTDATHCKDFTISKLDQRFELSGTIRKKGWPVIAEVQFAQYKLIAFAGKFEPNTSSTCQISQSNIAIFENDDLLGVIYLGSSKDTLIGDLELMDNGFFVRIISGSLAQKPVAELHLSPTGLALKPISSIISYCDGKVIVPNTLGVNIVDGREIMFEFGFTPIPNEQRSDSWESKYYSGISELVGCSNGIPWCIFEYENEHSVVFLSTLGKDEVIRDFVKCKE